MEIVLVLAFLGIIISGVFPVFINSIEANKSAEYYSKIEEYRNADFNTLSSSQFDIPELPGGQGTFTVSNTVEGAPQNDIKQVNLVVHWDFKRARQVESSTYMSRGGIKK
jgi:hypothetical protein